MLKHIVAKVVVAVALLVAVAGGTGIVADHIGLDVTPSTYACSGGAHGGGC